MARILKTPFQFALDGAAAVVEQDSDQGNTEQLAVLCLTIAGERRLRPGFGLTDPTFDGFNSAELAAKLELYGPAISLEDVRVRQVDTDLQRVTIDFAAAA